MVHACSQASGFMLAFSMQCLKSKAQSRGGGRSPGVHAASVKPRPEQPFLSDPTAAVWRPPHWLMQMCHSAQAGSRAVAPPSHLSLQKAVMRLKVAGGPPSSDRQVVSPSSPRRCRCHAIETYRQGGIPVKLSQGCSSTPMLLLWPQTVGEASKVLHLHQG